MWAADTQTVVFYWQCAGTGRERAVYELHRNDRIIKKHEIMVKITVSVIFIFCLLYDKNTVSKVSAEKTNLQNLNV